MSDIGGSLKEKLGQVFHKIIFIEPIDESEEHFRVVKQKYFNPSKDVLKTGQVLNLKNWLYQRKAGYVEFRSWKDASTVYGFYKKSTMVKPTGEVLSSKELDADNTAKDAKAVFSGGSFGNPLILCILCLAAGVAVGVMVGYLGIPAGLGQHLVPNGAVVPAQGVLP